MTKIGIMHPYVPRSGEAGGTDRFKATLSNFVVRVLVALSFMAIVLALHPRTRGSPH